MRIAAVLGIAWLSGAAAVGHDEHTGGLKLPRGWSGDWRTEQVVLGSEGSEDCTVSRMGRYDLARGRKGRSVFFSTSPLDDLETPSIEPLNGTAGEQWEFDGISEDGTEAIIFGFYRDPNYSFLGTGNLRAYAEFALANGTRYAVVDYAEESVVESCPGRGTRGTWRGKEFAYTFEISADMSRTKITVDSPEVQGTVVMTSIVPPRYADGTVWPSGEASLLAVPHFYWTEPVPVANMAMDMVVNGRRSAWTGIAGHERLWGAYNWYTCLRSMVAIRARTGPFAVALAEFGSDLEKGLVVPSVILAEDGERVFSTRRTEPSGTEDFMRMRKLYGGAGATTEALADKVTGVELILESPGRKKQWKFVVTHKTVGFEYVLGEGTGGTGYSGMAEGGLVGAKEQWSGPAFTEFMRFPQKSWLLAKNYVV